MSALSATPAITDWLDRARALEPVVAKYRDEGEQARHLSAPLVEALRERGFFHLWLPQRFGGPELPLDQVVPILEELARQDGAVGWSVAIGIESSFLAAYLPPATLDAIYAAHPQAVLSGSIQPKGRAVAVDGGYQVSGRWPLASGCHHADWLVGNSIVYDGEALRCDAHGAPIIRSFVWPAARAEILDTWYSTGLRGTGSHDIQVVDLFVPEGHHCSLLEAPTQSGALFQAGIFSVLAATIAAVALGIGRAALEEFGQLAQVKIPSRNIVTLAEQAVMHERVAEAEALVRSARAFLMETVHAISAAGEQGREVTEELRTLKDLASGHAARSAAQAVDLLYQAAGTSSIYASSRLDRCFRDVHTMGQHFGVGLTRKVAAGGFLLRQYAAVPPG
jgi:indole-3-acetate monooxygenase